MLKVIFFQNIEDIVSLSLPSVGGMEKPAIILIVLFFCWGDVLLCVCVCVYVPYNFFLFYLDTLSL